MGQLPLGSSIQELRYFACNTFFTLLARMLTEFMKINSFHLFFIYFSLLTGDMSSY